MQTAGWHPVRFEAGDLPAGVYFYALRVGGTLKTGRMVLLQ